MAFVSTGMSGEYRLGRDISLTAAFTRRCGRTPREHHLSLNHHCGELSIGAVYRGLQDDHAPYMNRYSDAGEPPRLAGAKDIRLRLDRGCPETPVRGCVFGVRARRFVPDSALEEGVRSELVSERRIPCYPGKIQGISSIPAIRARFEGRNDHYDQGLTSKFPTQRNRELISPYQGIKSAYQGIKSAYQGNFLPDQGRGARLRVPQRDRKQNVDQGRLKS